ncbi:hypothetical protein BC830DRAFT_1166006 [Chytriomyces sp. MP71]|nr:hypothetical protein BC830DRAFT_1166006 [Chytriomyces sp. MP71]
MLPLFKYTSSRASPLPPSKASSGFVAAAAAANGASRDYLAQAARFDSNLQQQKQQQQWQKQQTTQTQLSYVTRSFSSNLQLFNTNGQPAQAPKLADQFMTGGSGDGSTLTRERTMELKMVMKDLQDHPKMSRPVRRPVLTADAFFPSERATVSSVSSLSSSSASSTSSVASVPSASVSKPNPGLVDQAGANSLRAKTLARDSRLRDAVQSLDIVRITDRVVACGLPWNNKSDRKLHKNNVADLGLFLRHRYRDRFLVWNLTGDTSQGNYDTRPLNNQVVSFGISKAYQLSLKTLFDIARSMHAWLKLHPDNVAIVHCTNGVGRTGIAIAAYLRYSDTFSDAATAFEYFISRRTPNDQAWPSVSQRRYIQYFNNAILVNGALPTPYPLVLDCIVLNTIPDFDEYGGCRPGIEVYQNRKLIYSRVHSRLTRTPSGGAGVVLDSDNDSVLFQFSDVPSRQQGLVLDRDIQIRIFHCADPDDGTTEATTVVTMVNFSFHTGFMPAGFIRVAARDLDLSRRDVEDGRFGAGFSVDLVFEETQGVLRNMKEEDKPVNYARCLDKTVSKCLARLISYHLVKVDERLMKGLEGMGISRLMACIALQHTNNDMKLAYNYFKTVLSGDQPSAIPRPLPSIATSPTASSQALRDVAGAPTHSPASASTTGSGARRPPPSVADLRQQTQQGRGNTPAPPLNLNRDRSPSHHSGAARVPTGRKASNASSDGGGGETSVRSSIQRLESLLLKSAEVTGGPLASSGGNGGGAGSDFRSTARSTSRSPKEPSRLASNAMSAEDKAAEELLLQLRERRKLAQQQQSKTHQQQQQMVAEERIELVGTSSGVRAGPGSPRQVQGARSREVSPNDSGRRRDPSLEFSGRPIVPPPRKKSMDYSGMSPRLYHAPEMHTRESGSQQESHPREQEGDSSAAHTGDEYDYLDMYSGLGEAELGTVPVVSATLAPTPPPPPPMEKVVSNGIQSRTDAVKAQQGAPRRREPSTPRLPVAIPPVFSAPPQQKASAAPLPPPPPPPPAPPVARPSSTSSTPEPVLLEKSTSQSLTKLRESDVARKSTALKKRQTLLWRDVEGGDGSQAPPEKKAAVGKDGKAVEVKKFEELFCFVPGASKSGPKLVQKAQFTTLLDFRRANVIAIGMSRFTRQNMAGADLATFVNNLDTSKITIDDLVQLKQLIPTESEAKILNEYHNTPRGSNALPLAPAESFMIDLIKADLDIGQHVEAFLFLLQLPQEARDLNDPLDNMSHMCTLLQTSSDLKVVLRTVFQLSQLSNEHLGAGNASFRPWMGKEAKAIGFKIDGLVRLKDVKSADGKWSLLNFLVDLVNKNRPDVLDFTHKFHALKQIRQTDLRHLIAQLFHLDKTLTNLKTYQYKNADFLQKLKPFIDAASTSIAGIRARFDVFSQSWTETAKYFAEDPEDYILLPELFEEVKRNPDPFYHLKQVNQNPIGDNRKGLMHLFVAMHVFLFAFEDCVKQNRKRVEVEAKKLVADAIAAEDRRKREEARAIREGRPVPPRGEETFVVPDLQQYGTPTSSANLQGPSSESWSGSATMSVENLTPNNAMRNRASMMLLRSKEIEAQEMLERFSGMIKDQQGGLTDMELQEQAQTIEEEFAMRDGDESGSDAGRSYDGEYDGAGGYDSSNGKGLSNRDSFQSIVSAYPAGDGSRGKLCQDCFLPEDECYCNW